MTNPLASHFRRWMLLIPAGLLMVGCVVAGVMISKWPFTQKAVASAIQDRFGSTVEIRKFRSTYFPPGCTAEGVTLRSKNAPRGAPPLAAVERLVIRTNYPGLLAKHIDDVNLTGLHVTVPNKGSAANPLMSGKTKNSVTISRMNADRAILEISGQPGAKPLKLAVQHLTLDNLNGNGPLSYRVGLRVPEPTGDLWATGQLGPWNSEDAGDTPASGSFTLKDADLSVFKGISGSLSSQGTYNGSLRRLNCSGKAQVPNFHVVRGRATVPVSADFKASVDTLNGDVQLQSVQATTLRTSVYAQGAIAGHAGVNGKVATLDMSIREGRVDDLLRIFSDGVRPSMTGGISLHAHVELPPAPPGFLTRIRIEGDFGIGSGKFTNPKAQIPVDRLTESSRGEKKKQEEEDPETVLSSLKGHVSDRNGVATLSKVFFSVPGALALTAGTYDLRDRSVDMHGVLRTTGKLSDTTSGFKALALKVVGPFLKKNAVTVVPFTIKGTTRHPVFALDLDAKRRM